MLTDYQILRINENADISTIKSAYRKLVKKIHPDVTNATFEKHLLLIQINRAYERLMKNKKAIPAGDTKAKRHRHPATVSAAQTARTANQTPPRSQKTGAVIKHKDPAYAFYKTGMNCFMKIHPSQWHIEVSAVMDAPGEKDMRELEKIKTKVKNLVKLFPKAYYYFSIVVHEYPDSVWHRDAKRKMTLIEERTLLYKKIIESFTEHAKTVPRVNRMFFNKRS
ncbi:MAG: J domain-containing protein [Spirochaetales bacterium]|nr:J domain-containing protein [Spirochaetales bacterium]